MTRYRKSSACPPVLLDTKSQIRLRSGFGAACGELLNSSQLPTNERLELMRNEYIEDGPTHEQIKHYLQQSILRNYPNPKRTGCLDSPAIILIAQQRLPHEDSRWEHISHCSPCYREFL